MIQIWLDRRRPPAGHVESEAGERSQPFAGWLQLLSILADEIGRPEPVSPASDEGPEAPGES